MECKISIITICYNSEKYIEDAIKSVVNQPYQNKEYIIIDGGSTDRTLEIINKYQAEITYFISEPDMGVSDAFNKGIRAATGDIIGICNADDMLVDNALTWIAGEYEAGVDVFRFQEYILNPNTGMKKLIKPTHIPAIPIQTHLLHMGCWIARSAYNRFGMYDLKYKYAMDYELMRRFISRGARLKYCDKPVGIFRLGGVSQSNRKGIEKEKLFICIKHGGGIVGGLIWILYDRFKIFCKKTIKKRNA